MMGPYTMVGFPTKGTQKIPNQYPKMLRVIDAWDYLNDIAFDSEMTRPKIVVWDDLEIIRKGKKYPLDGAYDPHKRKIWLYYGDKNKLETLFHEMVHQFVYDILGDIRSEHGKVFQEVYKEGLRRIDGVV